MKKNFHICFASHDEVMFRDEEDYLRGYNCLALSLYDTGTALLADSFMSDHCHLAIHTEDASSFIQSFRIRYNKYFNWKYSRTGGLGEKNFFCDEVVGHYHLQAVISYILRNVLHHGVMLTPFGNMFSSVNCYFQKYLGHSNDKFYYIASSQKSIMPKNSLVPSGWTTTPGGVIRRECYVESSTVENNYVSPRSFLYNMNRLSGDEWTREQMKDDGVETLVTLDLLEKASRYSISELYDNERARFDGNRTTDLQVCKMIDDYLLSKYHRQSYTKFSFREKKSIVDWLLKNRSATSKQACRCLGLPYESL